MLRTRKRFTADGRFGKLSRARAAAHEFSVSRVFFPGRRQRRGAHLSRVVSSLSKIEAHSAHMTSMPAAESWRLYIPLPAVGI